MENIDSNRYEPPVNSLLTYGIANHASPEQWSNYSALGLGPEHIPDLIRMATNKELNEAYSDTLEVWAPLHAWRALGQLQAEEAAMPLLSLCETLEEKEWVESELPEVFAQIGPPILPVLTAFLADASSPEESRTCAIDGIGKIAAHWPEARPACIEFLMKQLALFAENDPMINSSLILNLVDLKAIEAAFLIEEAFKAERIDPFMMDWEDVQEELGLLPADKMERRRNQPLIPNFFSSPLPQEDFHSERPARKKSVHGTAHQKSKEKMAKQSRKKNRKR
jgi:hypothetical protein